MMVILMDNMDNEFPSYDEKIFNVTQQSHFELDAEYFSNELQDIVLQEQELLLKQLEEKSKIENHKITKIFKESILINLFGLMFAYFDYVLVFQKINVTINGLKSTLVGVLTLLLFGLLFKSMYDFSNSIMYLKKAKEKVTKAGIKYAFISSLLLAIYILFSIGFIVYLI